MTVLVTGGSGLVGSHVIEALRTRGEPVRALVRAPSRDAVAALGADPVAGDVTDPAAWSRAARGVRAVVHAAAMVGQRESYERFVTVNVGATQLAIAAARAAGARLIHISSVAVYGRGVRRRHPGESIAEDHPFQPLPARDFYARTKRLAEDAVREATQRGELSGVALRPNVVYGERDRLFTPKLVRLVRLGVVPRVGDWRNHLSCVYAGNVAAAVLAALDTPAAAFGPYHVTHDAPPALDQRAFVTAFATGLGVRVRPLPVPPAVARAGARAWALAQRLMAPRGYAGLGDSAVSFLTTDNPYATDRAQRELGWRPPWTTAAAIARTLAATGAHA